MKKVKDYSDVRTVSIVKLPPVSAIRRAKVDPYESFYLYICDQLRICFNVGEMQINQSAVTLSKRNEKTLADECKKWYWKHYDKKFMGKKYFLTGFLMQWLNYSPRIDEHKVVKDGYAMVDTRDLLMSRGGD